MSAPACVVWRKGGVFAPWMRVGSGSLPLAEADAQARLARTGSAMIGIPALYRVLPAGETPDSDGAA